MQSLASRVNHTAGAAQHHLSALTNGVSQRTAATTTKLITMLEFEDDRAPEVVETFEYKQEFARKLSTGSIIGLSFALMDVPFGIALTIHILLINGGNVTMLYGWVAVTVFLVCVAALLGEIASKFPTSGGVYHFSALLAHPRYLHMVLWITGWFLLVGTWIMVAAYVFSGAEFVLSLFGLGDEVYRRDVFVTVVVFEILMVVCGLVNIKIPRHLDTINKACVYWTVYTVLLIDAILLLTATSFHTLKHVFTNFNNTMLGGYPPVLLFLVGLQLALFTLNGYGMIPAMLEEVKTPEKTVPRGMVYLVTIAGLTGVIFIIPILLILPELDELLQELKRRQVMPIDLIFKLSTKSYVVLFLFVVLLIGTALFAGIGAITTASRATYAFARDRGLPWQEYWVHVEDMADDDDDLELEILRGVQQRAASDATKALTASKALASSAKTAAGPKAPAPPLLEVPTSPFSEPSTPTSLEHRSPSPAPSPDRRTREDGTTRIPKNAIYLLMAVPMAFGLLALVLRTMFQAFVGLLVTLLTVANGLPVLCLVLGRRRKVRGAPFRLRLYLGYLVNGVLLGWVVLNVGVLSMPALLPVTATLMNYSLGVVLVVLFVTILGYYTYGRTAFNGPNIGGYAPVAGRSGS